MNKVKEEPVSYSTYQGKHKICIFVIAKKIKTTPMLCKDKITSIFCIIDDIHTIAYLLKLK